MVRAILFFIKVAIIVAVAVWLANNPGNVSIDWLDRRIETSMAVLVFVFAIVAVAIALIYRFWRFIYKAPASVKRSLGQRRRLRGYRALSHGMVAVAAGDGGEAQKYSDKAARLLEDPPLTLLLQAQAAQLNGDHGAAKRFFEAMLTNPETRFLGLRGLVLQSIREGNETKALEYVKQAHAMRPNTPWVLETLVELSERHGDLIGAEKAAREAGRRKALPGGQAEHKRLVIMLERAVRAEAEGKTEEALAAARRAHKLQHRSLPAAIVLSRIAAALGRRRETMRVLERAWAHTPHPELAATCKRLNEDRPPLERLQALRGLVNHQPNHRESHLALAEANLEAELWGETRRHLEAAGGDRPTARVCLLMAQLEEGEYGAQGASSEWYQRAAVAPPDPAWVCRNCAAVNSQWDAHCGVCNEFDTLEWREPQQRGTTVSVASGDALLEPKEPRRESASGQAPAG